MTANQNKIVRAFCFSPDFVSCGTCALNYNGKTPEEKSFCQEFSMPINPKDEKANMDRAHSCPHWNPEKVSRAVMSPDTPEHKRWYEEMD